MNIALFGCGPHAKRIYVQYMLTHEITPSLIVDVVGSRNEIEKIISDNGWGNTKTFFVSGSDPYVAFTQSERAELIHIINDESIDKAIISTPPEVHVPYTELCLEAGAKVLIDKPLSAPRNVSVGNADQIVKDLEDLLKYDQGDNIVIQCQRRRHQGYQFIKDTIDSLDQEYGLQPHFIDVYHSDGRWDFPDEIPKLSNHPYAYGYGKLLHSGYHFVDLVCFLTEGFDYDTYNLTAYANTIHDFKTQIPDIFYKQTFNINNTYVFPEEGFGEIDCHSLIQLQRGGRTITTIAMNLLHTGFSRRAWGKAKDDLYKGNGRLRHERVNIQIGPLMNIQVHSYQSTEVHDVDQPARTECGGLEHFDIHIYRNADLIGGKPYELITLDELEKSSRVLGSVGQNERARYQLVTDFLGDRPSHSSISSHLRTNVLLAAIAKSMHRRHEIRGDLNI
ncbi:MAG: Gfo/Idh/MocA family oxidoreductase [Candidatus Saccharimonas sp.]|nr:Gfo/Idh/MocA family oxidoreductase [Candidatus Saccharimonas sp.]